jgi:hypothetical protein
MNLKEILKEVYAGKKITLGFESKAARENFRVALYKAKSPEDKVLTDILDVEKQTLRFEKIDDMDTLSDPDHAVRNFKAKIWLENKPSEPDFEVLDIE